MAFPPRSSITVRGVHFQNCHQAVFEELPCEEAVFAGEELGREGFPMEATGFEPGAANKDARPAHFEHKSQSVLDCATKPFFHCRTASDLEAPKAVISAMVDGSGSNPRATACRNSDAL
jgi:hypothetical protein